MPHTILVADDSATIRTAISIAFEKEPYALVQVSNGTEAISQARLLQPALVLADHLMPGKSGYEVAEALRVDPATSHIPVIMLSGSAAPFDEARFQASGALAHLEKPFDCHTIIDKVNEIIRANESAQGAASAAQTPATPQPQTVQPAAAAPSVPQSSQSVQLPQAPVFAGTAPSAPAPITSTPHVPAHHQEATVIRAVPEHLLHQNDPVAPQPTSASMPQPSPPSEDLAETREMPPLGASGGLGDVSDLDSLPSVESLQLTPDTPTAATATPVIPNAAIPTADTITQIVPEDLLMEQPPPAHGINEPTAPAVAEPSAPSPGEDSSSAIMDFDLEHEFEKFMADVDDTIVPDASPDPLDDNVAESFPEPSAVTASSLEPSAVESMIDAPAPLSGTGQSSPMASPLAAPTEHAQPLSVPLTPAAFTQDASDVPAPAPVASMESSPQDVLESDIQESITDLLGEVRPTTDTESESLALTKDLTAEVAEVNAAHAIVDLVEDQIASPSPLQREELLAESRTIIEKVVWEVVPALAETLIREEIERLLKARDAE